LTNSDSVANLDVIKGRRAVNRDSSMSLLISVILFDEMNVVSSNNNSVLHFGRNNNSLKDLSSNANVACEGALLINISSFNGFFRSSESETNVFIISNASFSSALDELSVLEESSLFLKCLFSLSVSESLPSLPFCFRIVN